MSYWKLPAELMDDRGEYLTSKLKDFFEETLFKALFACALILGALFLYTLLPPSLQKISVEAVSPLEPNNTAEVFFNIKNTGTLPIFDLQGSYSVTTLRVENRSRLSEDKWTLFVSEKPCALLWPDEKCEIELQINQAGVRPVSFVDMTVVVEYRLFPRFPFYKREQSFHFMTAKKKDGLLGWYLQP